MRLTTVRELLARPTYAGYVEAPNWGVSLRKGFHEPLIDLATHERIQARLRGAAVAPARKDINEDFPLRGFLLYDNCDQPMTSCWSKGRNRHYAYYLCDTPDCASHRRSIPRADIEDGAEAILRSMQPARQFFALARAMFTDIWNMRQAEAKRARAALSDQIRDIEKQIEGLLDRIIDGASPTVAAAYGRAGNARAASPTSRTVQRAISAPQGKPQTSSTNPAADLAAFWARVAAAQKEQDQ